MLTEVFVGSSLGILEEHKTRINLNGVSISLNSSALNYTYFFI